MLQVRKAIEQDFEKIMEIYRYAQDFMIQDGQTHGIFRCAADYCKSISANVRIDTHENNTTMQRQIEKNGFKRCGTIYVEDGSPRIAYHWTAE